MYLHLNDRRTALYRLYGDGEVLLYIGISHQPEVRFEQHASQKAWWPQVVRRDVEWFDDRPTAEVAEAAAIRAEDPEHNGTYSPRRSRKSIRHIVAADGVEEISLTLARAKLTGLVRRAEGGTPIALLNHGQRYAYIVSAEEFLAMRELRVLAEELEAGDSADDKHKARIIAESLATAKFRALDST